MFADLAADILEDEDEEQLMQEAAAPTISLPEPTPQQPTPQIVVDNSGGHVQLVTSGTGTPGAVTRQVIVSQGQIQPANQVVFTTSGAAQIKPGTTPTTNAPQTVIVNAGQQRNPVVIQQANPQFLLSSGLQGNITRNYSVIFFTNLLFHVQIYIFLISKFIYNSIFMITKFYMSNTKLNN